LFYQKQLAESATIRL